MTQSCGGALPPKASTQSRHASRFGRTVRQMRGTTVAAEMGERRKPAEGSALPTGGWGALRSGVGSAASSPHCKPQAPNGGDSQVWTNCRSMNGRSCATSTRSNNKRRCNTGHRTQDENLRHHTRRHVFAKIREAALLLANTWHSSRVAHATSRLCDFKTIG